MQGKNVGFGEDFSFGENGLVPPLEKYKTMLCEYLVKNSI